MSNSVIKKLKNEIKESVKEKNYDRAYHRTIKLASYYKEAGQYDEALKEYAAAKIFVKRCSPENRNEYEYIIDKGLIETMFAKGDDRNDILALLQNFLEKYDQNNNSEVEPKQGMYYFVAWSYSYLNKIEEGKLYALKSLEALNEFQTKNLEFELRKASTYRILADLALDETKAGEAKDYCEKALNCKGVKNNIKLYYALLNIKRHYVKREDRLDISQEMVKLFNNHKAQLKDKKFNTYICSLEDYFVHKDFEKAEEAYFVLYQDPECLKNDTKNEIKTGLIVLYERRKRLELIEELKKASTIDYKKIALIYERCCQELSNLSALEILIEYYERILNICKFIDGDNIYGDLSFFCKTLTAVIEVYYDLGTYNRTLGHEFSGYYDKAVFYGTILYEAQKRAGAPENVLAGILLNQAIKQVYCKKMNFESKRKAFTDIKNLLESDMQQVRWYTNYICLLESNPQYRQSENMIELKNKLQEYQDKIRGLNVGSPVCQRSYTDEYDELSENEILKRVEENLKTFNEIEKLKKRIHYTNSTSGETHLHATVLNSPPGIVDEHIKLLFEKCGYLSIIDVPDNIGMTPLHTAVLYSNFEVAEYLLQNHAKVNTATSMPFKPNNGLEVPPRTTPLMEACSQGNAKLIQLLLKYKADPLMKDSKGDTSIKYLENVIKYVAEEKRPELTNILNLLKNS